MLNLMSSETGLSTYFCVALYTLWWWYCSRLILSFLPRRSVGVSQVSAWCIYTCQVWTCVLFTEFTPYRMFRRSCMALWCSHWASLLYCSMEWNHLVMKWCVMRIIYDCVYGIWHPSFTVFHYPVPGGGYSYWNSLCFLLWLLAWSVRFGFLYSIHCWCSLISHSSVLADCKFNLTIKNWFSIVIVFRVIPWVGTALSCSSAQFLTTMAVLGHSTSSGFF